MIDKFFDDATELDVDAVCDGKMVVIGGVMEHVEEAGIHSGDSACFLPPVSLSKKVLDEVKRQTKLLALNLKVKGLINIQFAIKNEQVYILEVNPRASRTVPFVSKAIGVPLAKIAAKIMTGMTLKELKFTKEVGRELFRGQGSGVPVPEIPGLRRIARAGNALDRRSDGHFARRRHRVREIADSGGNYSASERDGIFQRP